MRWLRSERDVPVETYDELWRWSVDDLEGFWALDLGLLRRPGRRRRTTRCSGSRDDAGRGVVPGRAADPTPSTSSATATTPRSAIRHASELRGLVRADLGRAARADRPDRRRPARAGRRPGRPRRRLHAEHPRDDRGVPRLRVDRRGLVELLAGLRRALGRRPLRADRAEGAARGRRLPLRRPRLRPARRGRRARARDAVARARRGAAVPGPRWRHAARRPSALRLPTRRAGQGVASPTSSRAARAGRSSSSSCRSTTRSGSSTRRARPGCRRRSSRATAGSCSSTSRSSTCTSTRSPATASSGSRRPAG